MNFNIIFYTFVYLSAPLLATSKESSTSSNDCRPLSLGCLFSPLNCQEQNLNNRASARCFPVIDKECTDNQKDARDKTKSTVMKMENTLCDKKETSHKLNENENLDCRDRLLAGVHTTLDAQLVTEWNVNVCDKLTEAFKKLKEVSQCSNVKKETDDFLDKFYANSPCAAASIATYAINLLIVGGIYSIFSQLLIF